MSFDRTLSKKDKRESLKRAKTDNLCRWCGQDVHRLSRQRRTFCSDECVHEFRLRSDSGYLREQVYKRDRGVCSKCGLSCSQWFSEFKRWLRTLPLRLHDPLQKSIREHAVREFFLLSGMKPVPHWQHRSTFWDADHINPVIENGGTCGLDGVRTLCICCHQEETKELKKRMKDGYWGYIAYHEGVARYVGIGSEGRWDHVNSGASHNEQLNHIVNKGGILNIQTTHLRSWKEACDWEKSTIAKFGRKDLGKGPLFNHTDGGDGGNITGGRVWAHNPETGKSGMFLSVPEGWVKGQGPDRAQSMKGVGKGLTPINNGVRETRIPREAVVPEGWKPGRLSRSTRGLRWFNNGVDQGMFKVCPEGWTQGRLEKGRIWITNGECQKKHDPSIPIPEGWKEGGISNGGKGKIWAHNPATGERGRFRVIPEGWTLGKGEVKPSEWSSRGLLFFHNPSTGEVTRSKVCPGSGWEPGMGKRRR